MEPTLVGAEGSDKASYLGSEVGSLVGFSLGGPGSNVGYAEGGFLGASRGPCGFPDGGLYSSPLNFSR